MPARRLSIALAAAWLALPGAAARGAPPPAKTVLAEAARSAKTGKRNLLVVFHASWCGWCRKLDAVLSAPAAREVISRHYGTAELTVLERGAREALENPGAEELLASIAGADAGLPFTAVLDRRSLRPIATSNTGGPGTNIGYPSKADEIEHFVGMLRKGAPRMSAAEAETVRAAFPAPR